MWFDGSGKRDPRSHPSRFENLAIWPANDEVKSRFSVLRAGLINWPRLYLDGISH